MKLNRTKRLLQNGKSACGSWVSLANPLAAELMGIAGFDWLLIDMEHGTGDYQTLALQVMAINAAGETTPVVRVQSNDPVAIKRVLDVGAAGIMVPGVKTAEEAKLAVAATRYAPEGIRSVAATRVNAYSINKSFMDKANKNIAVFIQIETAEAVENIEDILDVTGIDVIFIGPNDLAAALGHRGDRDHPTVQCAIKKVEDATKRRGISLGSVSRDKASAAELLERGYGALSVMGDTAFILAGARQHIAAVRTHQNYIHDTSATNCGK